MLKRWSILLLALISCVAIACDDDDDPTDNNGNGDGNGNGTTYANTVSASLNGKPFTALNFVAVSATGGGVTSMSVAATGADKKQVTIAIAIVNGTKTYTIDGQLVNGNAHDGDISASRDASGSINLTNFTSEGAKGTFSFTVKNADGLSVDVQEGKFDVAFNN